MHYKKNFLTNVILRLDFGDIEALMRDHDLQFSKDVAELYPIVSKNKIDITSFSFSPENDSIQRKSGGWRWGHQNDKDGKKAVYLLPNAIIFEYKEGQYKHFPAFYKDMGYVYEKFQNNYNINEFTRLGLRYVNEIVVPGIDPLNWDGYIKSNLSAAIRAGLSSNSKLVRSMHQLHFLKEDIITIFNYGIHNKDYPNPVSRPAIILDYDCYIVGKITNDEVFKKIEELNVFASDLFESSIDDNLRVIMERSNEP